MKSAFVAFEAVTFVAVVALLRRLRRSTARVVAYGWQPLALWEIAGNGHVDAMTALMMLALWLFAAGRALAAGVAAADAALFKPFALLMLPTFWRPWDAKLPFVVLGVIALAYAPYLSVGTAVLGFLPGYVGACDPFRSSARPTQPPSAKRMRQRLTVRGIVPRSRAIERPSAAISTIRARKAWRCSVVGARRRASSSDRSPGDSWTSFAAGTCLMTNHEAAPRESG